MAKTYEELLAGATQIKNNELPESNTHSLVGGQLVDMVEKQKEDSERIDNVSKSHKGYFQTLEQLKAKYPTPKEGETAWVGEPYPGNVYDVVDGAWHDTGVPANEGGGSGTSNYNDLENKPSIGNVSLEGNKTLDELGIASKQEVDSKQDVINQVNVNVDNETGTPFGSASVSGSTLIIYLKNIKGKQGETGPANTITIGTVNSTDEASAIIRGDAPNQFLDLNLPRGPQGNSGVTGNTEDLVVVNDLNGGESEVGAVKVLAAEQGKVLDEKIKSINTTNIDSYNILGITGFGEDAARGGITKEGDIFYNTSTKLLRRCDSYTNPYTGTFSTVPFDGITLYYNYSNNSIYRYENGEMLYVLNSTLDVVKYSVLHLENIGKGWSNNRIVRLGEVYYNTEEKALKMAVEKNMYGEISLSVKIPLRYDAVYYYNGIGYKWNGNDLVSVNNYEQFDIEDVITMQGGQISESTGRPLGAITIDDAFLNYFNQPNFLVVQNRDEIVNVLLADVELVGFGTLGTGLVTKVGDIYYNTDTKLLRMCTVFGQQEQYETVPYVDGYAYYNKQDGKYYEYNGEELVEKEFELESLNVHCYSNPTTYLGKTSSEDLFKLKEGTNLVKFEIFKTINYTKNRALKVRLKYHANHLEFIKNDIIEKPTEKYISYEIELPTITDEVSEDLSYHGNNSERVYNNGFLILPPNYTVSGEPVPLVIFCHGTEGYTFGEQSIISYGEYLRFIAYNGYAVADCSAVSSKYKNEYDGNGPTPLGISCYTSLYKYIANNYNIKTDGVYVFGKSSGGILTILLSQLQPFHVKVAAGLAPTTDIFANMKICLARSTNFWVKQLGLNREFSDYISSSEDKQYILDNVDKFVGYNPLWLNTVGLEHKNTASEIINTSLTTEALEGNELLVNSINEAHKTTFCPLKIWHAIDDVNVPIATSRFYQNMVKKAGGICYIREFPANCGQHHAVDNAVNAPKVKYKTKYYTEIEIPVAYAELVDWFNGW